MTYTANNKEYRNGVEAYVIGRIKRMPDNEFVTLAAMLDTLDAMRKSANELLTEGYLDSPDQLVKDTLQSNRILSNHLIDKYAAAPINASAQQIFDDALLLSVTNMYLAENLVAEIDYKTHHLYSSDVSEADAVISNP